MKELDAIEIAYKNGYEKALKDHVVSTSQHEKLKRLCMIAIAYGLKAKTDEKSSYDCIAEYLLDHGVRVCGDCSVPVYTPEELARKYGEK